MNMLSLYLIGVGLERILGRVRFAVVYLLSLLGGSVAVFLFSGVVTATAGASGAIFGLLGALAVTFKRLNLDLRQLGAIIVLNLVITFTAPGISWQAHLGGFVVGAIVGAAMVYPPAKTPRGLAVGCLGRRARRAGGAGPDPRQPRSPTWSASVGAASRAADPPDGTESGVSGCGRCASVRKVLGDVVRDRCPDPSGRRPASSSSSRSSSSDRRGGAQPFAVDHLDPVHLRPADLPRTAQRCRPPGRPSRPAAGCASGGRRPSSRRRTAAARRRRSGPADRWRSRRRPPQRPASRAPTAKRPGRGPYRCIGVGSVEPNPSYPPQLSTVGTNDIDVVYGG